VALLNWSTKYSVGVQSMDTQHKVLFGMLNDLHEAMMKGQAQNVSDPLLRKLVSYTHDHFSAEEAMMASTGYQGIAQHRIEHRDLIKQVDEFASRCERGESNLNLQLLNFLRNWLTNHIQQEDQKYGPWANEHGRK